MISVAKSTPPPPPPPPGCFNMNHRLFVAVYLDFVYEGTDYTQENCSKCPIISGIQCRSLYTKANSSNSEQWAMLRVLVLNFGLPLSRFMWMFALFCFFVCLLLNIPSNMLVYLRDGSAHTIYLLPTSPSADPTTPSTWLADFKPLVRLHHERSLWRK